jgi:hypothetical protein
MTSLQLSGSAPPNWGLHPKLATIVNRRGTSTENAQKGNSLGDSPSPHQDPVLSAKVTTGGLSAPHLQMEGGVPPPMYLWVPGPPVQAPLLIVNIKESQVSIMVEKQKVIFLQDSGACFSVLPFFPGSWSPVQ